MSQYPVWSPAEIELLDQLAGDVPFPELLRKLHREAAEHGWPLRTRKAVLVKLSTLGHRAMARQGAVLTTGGAAGGGGAAAAMGWPAAIHRPPIVAAAGTGAARGVGWVQR